MRISSRTLQTLAFLFALFFLTGANPVWSDSLHFDNNPAIATINGKPVRMDDIENAQIHDLRVQLHQLQSQALKEKITQEYMEAHPELAKDGVRSISEEDVETFHKNTPRAREMGSLDKMRGQLRNYLESVARSTDTEKKFQAALAGGWAKVLLTSPNDFKVVAHVGNAALWFGDSAPGSRKVFILEFSDFQCPFCKRVQPTLDTLRKRYGKDVQFGYRHFPLPFHKDAQTLAEATECAREQGKFWELQKLFYEKDSPDIKFKVMAHAKTAGVANMKAFEKCWKSEKYRERILTDIDEGGQVGIQATPGFIIGLYDDKKSTITGESFSGALPEEQFSRLIDKYLNQSAQ